jgi:hypothetical protein
MMFVLAALFAALAFAFMQGSRSSGTMITDEQAKQYAASTISYGVELKNGFQRLVARGCNSENIGFDNASVAGYTHAASPQARCKIFDVSGAALKWNAAPRGNDGSAWIITANRVLGVDDDTAVADSEIIAVLPNVTLSVCQKINTLLNAPAAFITTPPQDAGTFTLRKHAAALSVTNAENNVLGSALTTPAFSGLKSLCFRGSTDHTGANQSANYFFYTILESN